MKGSCAVPRLPCADCQQLADVAKKMTQDCSLPDNTGFSQLEKCSCDSDHKRLPSEGYTDAQNHSDNVPPDLF